MDYTYLDKDARREFLRKALAECELEHNRLALSLVSNEASQQALKSQLDALGD